MPISDLSTWCQEAEAASIGFNWADFGLESGLTLPQDKKNYKIYSEKLEQLSKLLLYLIEDGVISRNKVPDVLYFDAIENKQKSRTSNVKEKIIEARKEEIKISGYPVSISSWRQFNLKHLKEQLDNKSLK